MTRRQANAVLAAYHQALTRAHDAGTRSASTTRLYRSRVADYLTWLTDHARLPGDALRDPHARNTAVSAYQTWLTDHGRQPTTINAALTAIDDLYTHLGLGPAVTTRQQPAPPSPRALDAAAQRRFLRTVAHLGSVRDQAICTTLYYTGLRTSELVGLDLPDLHLTGRRPRLIVRSAASDRDVPLPPDARPALRTWRYQRADWPSGDASTALFVNYRGGRLSTRAVTALLAEVGAAAGLTRLTPQLLRHTYRQRLHRDGVHPARLAELLGQRPPSR